MKAGVAYLSKEKKLELEKELEFLKSVRRQEIADELEHAKSLGDLSENAEYHEARDAQAKAESRILELEDTLKNAEILKHHVGDTVDVGSTVVIQKEKETNKQTYDIVGPEEADMLEGKLSYKSPLGQALLAKTKGDTFNFETPKGKVEYKIVDVK